MGVPMVEPRKKKLKTGFIKELAFIREQAQFSRGRFNFAVLAEEAQKVFGHPFHRATFRLFALRHGSYHDRPEEKKKVYVRLETPGPGFFPNMILPNIDGYQIKEVTHILF